MRIEADKDFERRLQDITEVNKTTEDVEILKLKNELGWTIAHAQARRGWRTDSREILKLETVHGYTVAHAMAFYGEYFTQEKILNWKTKLPWLPSGEKLKMQPVTVKQMRDL